MSKQSSVSLIATVLNEAANITEFLESYHQQTLLANEFIIVDAGSADQTVKLIENFAKKYPQLKIKLISLPGANRSQARNRAAVEATGEYLAFTDAGCLLDRFWLAELVSEQVRSKEQVVGGWFKGLAKNNFQEAIIPYFLQLARNLSSKSFVPTTRSLLINKKTFVSVGKFKEQLDLSEDYELMLRLRRRRVTWAFAQQAIVYWLPPHNYREFLQKIASFARSDIEAGIVRPKVLSLYARYVILLLAWYWSFYLGLLVTMIYLSWSITKNYHNCPRSWYYLPVLQVSTDVAIMTTSLFALKKFRVKAV